LNAEMQRIESSWNGLVGLVGGNTYEHYAEHIGWIHHLISESSATR
jgi:hypothetical protein